MKNLPNGKNYIEFFRLFEIVDRVSLKKHEIN
jgi:hypothetical protein